MATKYLTCAETAKLVRKALKESFPDIKFSVKSSNYSGGASIRVSWIDGP
ncbi:LPD29 domain-containing protein, partial [Xylella fastidiosa]